MSSGVLCGFWGSALTRFRHNHRVRPLLCALSLLCGCVAYEQDVLTPLDLATVAPDLRVHPPDGDSPRCSRQQNSAPRCLDPSAWVKSAAKTCCELLQQQLHSVDFAGPCSSGAMVPIGYSTIGFECCPQTASEPSADCQAQKLGGSSECLDDGLWKFRASVSCGKAGRTLGSVRTFGSCSIGRSIGVTFDCCSIVCPQSGP